LTASICVLDPDGNIVAVNEAWRRFSAANDGRGDYVGESYLQVCDRVAGDDHAIAHEIAKAVRDVLAGRRSLMETEYPCPSSEEQRWFLLRVTELRDKKGNRTGAVVSHQDVTSRRLLEERLKLIADTDELTGLPNRRKFLRLASEALQAVKKASARVSLVVLDLDRFKEVNDKLGHDAGDETLRQIADQLSRGLRPGDILARWGGEELVVLLPQTDQRGAIQLAGRLRARIEGYSIETTSVSFSVTASFGVTQLLENDDDLRAALARADKALYDAKEAGRNRVRSRSLELVRPAVA
ncbi:MAG: diguanylate cyclase, partial [Rhizobiaceae bacterium]|nr:diguanylate cyclase [Rhizobiaceae bacterium]